MVSEMGFVDREKEFLELKKLLDRCNKEKGSVVFVTGEDGLVICGILVMVYLIPAGFMRKESRLLRL